MGTDSLIPRQPYHMLLTDQYTKKIILRYGISHFYECRVGDGVSEIPTSVPDGCIDIMFYWSHDLDEMGADVLGTLLQPHAVKVHSGCHYFGVRFLPGQHFFPGDISFSEMVEHTLPLEKRLQGAILVEQIATAASFSDRMRIFMEAYLPGYGKQMDRVRQNSLSQYAIGRIIKAHGNVTVKDLAESAGYSERNLNRVFTGEIGITPKKFSRIIRFQNALQALEEHGIRDYRLCDINEFGYYDEAHFIHDFKAFCGQSPVKFMHELQEEGMMDRLTIL